MFFNWFQFTTIVEIMCIILGTRGAVLLDNQASDQHKHSTLSRTRRSAFLQMSWTRNDNYGIVFVYSNDFSSQEVRTIFVAATEIALHSCFPVNVFSTTEYLSVGGSGHRLFRNHVFISRNQYAGCISDIGMFGGRQKLNLDPVLGCALRKGTVIHEMMHSLGYDHEQNRPDRDNFVSVHYGNIIAGNEINFKVKRNSKAIGPYDYFSIMHYPSSSHAINPRYPTLSSKLRGYEVPQSSPNTLSEIDTEKIRVITGCKSTWL